MGQSSEGLDGRVVVGRVQERDYFFAAADGNDPARAVRASAQLDKMRNTIKA